MSFDHKFFPLFLTIPQRQQGDLKFYHILQEIRRGQLLPETINIIQSKINTNNNFDKFYNITHIVNTYQAMNTINQILCYYLSLDNIHYDPIIFIVKDTFNFKTLDENHKII